MKQLLLCNSSTILVGDNYISKHDQEVAAQNGTWIQFFPLANLENDSTKTPYINPSSLSAITGFDFGITLGRPKHQMPLTIPEIDHETLSIVAANPSEASTFSVTFALPKNASDEVEVDEDYTIVLIKTGCVPHERNSWSFTYRNRKADPDEAAAKFVAEFNTKFQAMSFPFNASASDDEITITCTNAGERWLPKFADMLFDYNDPNNEDVTIVEGGTAILDAKYVKRLASECAAGKGFTDTYRYDSDVMPGYPEPVEDGSYRLYTLRFKVGRKAAKTRDEKVWQLVHIAVHTENRTLIGQLDTLFDF